MAAVDIVFPCLDESAALPWVLERLPPGTRAIVVDNGSTDGSAQVATALGATVLECTVRGYGAACQAGLEAATADIVAFCDCDASVDPSAVIAPAAAISRGDADLAVGRRRACERGTWPAHARMANIALCWRVRRSTGTALYDLGPVRVGRREALMALQIRDRRSGYPLETVIRAARAGWRIVPFDIDYRPRSGRSKVTGTALGTVRAVRDMTTVLRTC